MLKPSETAHNTESLFADLVPKYLDTSAIRVVTGGVPETTHILELKFDAMLYTGSTAGKSHP